MLQLSPLAGSAGRRQPLALGTRLGIVLGLGLMACAAGGANRSAGEPSEPASSASTEVPAARWELPPAPQGRSEEDLWAEVQRRAASLAPMIGDDIAAARPGPVPDAVRVGEASQASPPKPVPEPAAPGPESASRVASGAGAGVVGRARAGVPAIRIARKYTRDNGLPSNRISALYVDDNDAWVGTADAGVARLSFEEGNWLLTRVENGLASNRVSDIIKYKGRVFVATQEGVSIWDGASWVTQTAVEPVKLVNAIFRIHDGLLWVAARTMHGGLLTYDGEKWEDRSTIRRGTVLNNVADFGFDGQALWIGTTNRGVYRFDGGEWRTFTVADGLTSNFVYAIGLKGSNAYLGGCCGVSALEDGEWRVYDVAEGLPHSTVNAIAVDGDLVWFGSKNGLGVYDGFEFTNFYAKDGLTDDRITCLFVTRDEVWVGTADGLNRVEKD